jgi:DNA-binding NtrC family response regulator
MAHASKLTKSVMVVEDEALIRGLCVDVFREAGYDVVEADNADIALKLLEDGRMVAAIVSDVRMPGTMNGLQFSELVSRRWPEIAILLTSGHMRAGEAKLPRNSHFLPKPYKFLDLVRHIEGLVLSSGH